MASVCILIVQLVLKGWQLVQTHVIQELCKNDCGIRKGCQYLTCTLYSMCRLHVWMVMGFGNKIWGWQLPVLALVVVCVTDRLICVLHQTSAPTSRLKCCKWKWNQILGAAFSWFLGVTDLAKQGDSCHDNIQCQVLTQPQLVLSLVVVSSLALLPVPESPCSWLGHNLQWSGVDNQSYFMGQLGSGPTLECNHDIWSGKGEVYGPAWVECITIIYDWAWMLVLP